MLIPPLGEVQLALLDRIDGLLVPGSASNVHPSHYCGSATSSPICMISHETRQLCH